MKSDTARGRYTAIRGPLPDGSMERREFNDGTEAQKWVREWPYQSISINFPIPLEELMNYD